MPTDRRLPDPSPARRWAILLVGTLAQASSAIAYHGTPFLIPALRAEGMSLTVAASIAAAPVLGVMLALVPWGMVTDKRGERFVLIAGLAFTAAASLVAITLREPWTLGAALFVAGACAASTSAASGRMAVGWFPPERRGVAMGIRQTAQPLGVGFAAITLAVVAERHGLGWALSVPALISAVALALVIAVVIDPPRTRPAPASGPDVVANAHRPHLSQVVVNPYRGDRFLVRLHAVSALLVIPQFLVWTFALVWLIDERGWSAAAAGTLVALTQVAGAATRIAAGHLSDRVASRTRPTRWVAIAACVVMLTLGLSAGLGWSVAILALFAASMVTVADNGMALTAVVERAGPYWSGRAMGLQNTGQFLAGAVLPPIAAAAITQVGYASVFAAAAAFPALAIALVPVRGERPLE